MFEDAAQCEQLQTALRSSEDARRQLQLEVDRQKALVKQLEEALRHSQADCQALRAQMANGSCPTQCQVETVGLGELAGPSEDGQEQLGDPGTPCGTCCHDLHLLGSEQFTDRCILKQLMDEAYQLPLSSTNPQLAAQGPDFMLLAAHLSQCPWESTEALHDRVREGLAAQTAMDVCLNAHLQQHTAQMVEALVQAAECYLDRASHAAQDTSVPDVVLTGECGTYRPTEMLGKGSASVVYACEQLSASPVARQPLVSSCLSQTPRWLLSH